MSGLRSRDFSAKRQRLTDLSNAQKQRDLLELLQYITDCGHDASYAAELLQETVEGVDGLCTVHKLVSAVRSADGAAGFGRAGGTLDLSSASLRGVDPGGAFCGGWSRSAAEVARYRLRLGSCGYRAL